MKKLTIAIAMLTLAILPMACQKEKTGNQEFRFTATTERPQSDDAKVQLVDERFIVWEYDDEISIGSNTSGDSKHQAWLYYADPNSEDWSAYNGIFLTTLPSNSQYFLGLHPYSENNIISASGGSAFSATIDLPATQTYRNDNTFDKQVFPMVAWYGGEWADDPYTPFNLDFHSLAAIVRLQFLNTTGVASAIRSITVTSPDKQLCGLYTVNNYNTFDPYLTSLEPTKKTVTIDCGESGVTFGNNQLLTFYLVLPAFTGRDNTTRYNNLSVTVTNTSSQSCTSTIDHVNTRRNGITYMQALSIGSWTSGSPTPTITGNGTSARPFKVYDINDLQYLRDCYNSVERTINGQPITSDTYIKLMRSDIELTSSNWLVGIRNFVGHFETMNQQSHPGITNSCQNVPLFENISSGGVVTGLTVKSKAVFNIVNPTGVSPFCSSNDGSIIDCALTYVSGGSDYTISIFSPFAGICVTNNGTIQGCRCEARIEVQSSQNFAGICLHNNGTVQGCQAGDMTLRNFSAKGAGICYENSSTGIVKDCYFSSNIMNSTADWGGIVYENSGTVKHCYLSSTGHIYTSKGVGGIVRNNLGASSLVDYCWIAGPIQGRSVGGIVDSLVNGEVRNCFNRNTAMITVTTATSVGGGIAGYVKGGQVNNSYINDIVIMGRNSNTVGGIAGAVTGGSFSYCYSYEDNNVFYGTTTTATYSQCYLVDGSQASITTVNSSPASNFATLTTNLNGSGNINYSTWVQSSATAAPELSPYQE